MSSLLTSPTGVRQKASRSASSFFPAHRRDARRLRSCAKLPVAVFDRLPSSCLHLREFTHRKQRLPLPLIHHQKSTRHTASEIQFVGSNVIPFALREAVKKNRLVPDGERHQSAIPATTTLPLPCHALLDQAEAKVGIHQATLRPLSTEKALKLQGCGCGA